MHAAGVHEPLRWVGRVSMEQKSFQPTIPSSQGQAPMWLCLLLKLGLPEQAVGWFPLTEFSCEKDAKKEVQLLICLLHVWIIMNYQVYCNLDCAISIVQSPTHMHVAMISQDIKFAIILYQFLIIFTPVGSVLPLISYQQMNSLHFYCYQNHYK